MNDDIAIKVDNLTKSFKIPLDASSGIKQKIIKMAKGERGYREFRPLNDISFEIKKGEFFGIVGRNGSGKSTLLKTIAGIYVPDSGSVQVDGVIVPFIELGVGFNPELSGRENVYLNGALLGFSRSEMDSMYDDIVEFAELEDFMEESLKNYSSGMQVRLAFSIAIRADGDVLLLDEVLAVGDEAFQRKCFTYFDELKKNNKTVILVTHSMDNVRRYCTRAMLIKDGDISVIGTPDEVADEYYGINLVKAKNDKDSSEDEERTKPKLTAKVTSDRLLRPGDLLKMRIKYKNTNNNPVCVKVSVNSTNQSMMITNPRLLKDKSMYTQDTKQHEAEYILDLSQFNSGEYQVIALLEDLTTNTNIATYGYGGETLITIKNKDKSSSSGALLNKAKLKLLK